MSSSRGSSDRRPARADRLAEGLVANGVCALWYFCYLDNLPSVLAHGLLCRNEAKRLPHASFAEDSVQGRRRERAIETSRGRLRSVHDLVPLYLTSRTPTLYARREDQDRFVFLRLPVGAVLAPDVEFAFSDGNLGAHATGRFAHQNDLSNIDFGVVTAERWPGDRDGRRRRNAEILVESVPPAAIDALVVRAEAARAEAARLLAAHGPGGPPILVLPQHFF